MISIILPVYNGELYLAEAIDSILLQTYSDWELILVNDCSTDRTAEICREYADRDSRIRILTNEVNLRLPKSLNRGFAASHGDYLTWTSDDNLYEKDALQILLQEIEKGYDFVYTDMTYIDANGEVLPNKKDNISIWQGNCVGASFLYRRTVYEKVGNYSTSMFLVEDYDYWLRVARYFRLHYCPKRIYRYREHGGSLTSQRSHEIRQMRICLLEEQLACSLISDENKDSLRKQLLEDYFREDRMDDFRKIYRVLKKRGIVSFWRLPGSWRLKYLIGARLYHWQKRIRGKEVQ